ncbi:hypothetical protein DFJ58DRAFT_770477 [Suillus subalutaceus]|uniref:uncharacterized protein n=1 Tax=Suillus subalutaceus TaxID=48586 RepID=UPI001B885F3F|nr:uncharacterized protein DFJ58DRAFT_770477 [Suillus subalutaceus]KAG1865832.1 hypothetical protein DFJ58DRAFT_770477 [Suillus subalutaceus]
MSLLNLKVWPSIVALVAATAPQGAFAQIVANITCLSSFGWMNNSLGQTPCLVTAYLGSPCAGGSAEIVAIPAGTQYSGPPLSGANPCQCNSVIYSLTSACGVCQGLIPVTWSSWKTYCTTAFTQSYPMNIPTGTAVPNWAYLDVVTSNIFNATAAQLDGDLPESKATSSLSIISTVIVSPLASVTSTILISASLPASTTSTGSSTPTSKSSDVGATAGGVVGGIVGVGAIAGLAAWFFIRRRRSRRAPLPTFSQPQMTQPPRFYDPADPSTFPLPLSSTIQTNTSSVNQNFSQQSRPGQYNGVPEV